MVKYRRSLGKKCYEFDLLQFQKEGQQLYNEACTEFDSLHKDMKQWLSELKEQIIKNKSPKDNERTGGLLPQTPSLKRKLRKRKLPVVEDVEKENVVVHTRSQRGAAKAANEKLHSQVNMSLVAKLRRPSPNNNEKAKPTKGRANKRLKVLNAEPVVPESVLDSSFESTVSETRPRVKKNKAKKPSLESVQSTSNKRVEPVVPETVLGSSFESTVSETRARVKKNKAKKPSLESVQSTSNKRVEPVVPQSVLDSSFESTVSETRARVKKNKAKKPSLESVQSTSNKRVEPVVPETVLDSSLESTVSETRARAAKKNKTKKPSLESVQSTSNKRVEPVLPESVLGSSFESTVSETRARVAKKNKTKKHDKTSLESVQSTSNKRVARTSAEETSSKKFAKISIESVQSTSSKRAAKVSVESVQSTSSKRAAKVSVESVQSTSSKRAAKVSVESVQSTSSKRVAIDEYEEEMEVDDMPVMNIENLEKDKRLFIKVERLSLEKSCVRITPGGRIFTSNHIVTPVQIDVAGPGTLNVSVEPIILKEISALTPLIKGKVKERIEAMEKSIKKADTVRSKIPIAITTPAPSTTKREESEDLFASAESSLDDEEPSSPTFAYSTAKATSTAIRPSDFARRERFSDTERPPTTLFTEKPMPPRKSKSTTDLTAVSVTKTQPKSRIVTHVSTFMKPTTSAAEEQIKRLEEQAKKDRKEERQQGARKNREEQLRQLQEKKKRENEEKKLKAQLISEAKEREQKLALKKLEREKEMAAAEKAARHQLRAKLKLKQDQERAAVKLKQDLAKRVVAETKPVKPVKLTSASSKTNLNSTVTLSSSKPELNDTFEVHPKTKPATSSVAKPGFSLKNILPVIRSTPTRPIVTNYDIHNVGADDSSDDEDKPKKQIPSWAEKIQGNIQIEQAENVRVGIRNRLFGTSTFKPTVQELFGINSRPLVRRSSAAWETPPDLHHVSLSISMMEPNEISFLE